MLGFGLTVLYLAFSYLSPAVLIPALAAYHIQAIVAVLALATSIPGLIRVGMAKQFAFYCLLALLFFISVSSAWNNGPGAGARAAEDFCSNSVVFLLVAANCNSLRRIKLAIAVVATIAIYYIFQGARALHAVDYNSPFLLWQHVGEGSEWIPRIEGLSFVNDPNDFAQLLVCLLPLLWFWRRPGRKRWNLLAVYIPALIFVAGLYLTHSRGGMIALALVLFLGVRKHLGSAVSMACIIGFAMGLMALNFTGGRAISGQSGADRIDAWSAGLQFIKSSPLIGIGYGQFREQYEITAHNSFILCISELGLLGYLAWLALIVATLLGARWVLQHKQADETAMLESAEATPSQVEVPWFAVRRSASRGSASVEPLAEFTRCIRLATFSLLGFLAAAWFLSRAYVLTLYLLLGIIHALTFTMKRRAGWEEPLPAFQMAKATLATGFVMITVIYIIVRFHFAA
jgi:O-antigen ligase